MFQSKKQDNNLLKWAFQFEIWQIILERPGVSRKLVILKLPCICIITRSRKHDAIDTPFLIVKSRNHDPVGRQSEASKCGIGQREKSVKGARSLLKHTNS